MADDFAGKAVVLVSFAGGGGGMSGCLSWSSSGQGEVITKAIMSWVRKQVQQVDKTRDALGSDAVALEEARRWSHDQSHS
jgi:hypothetical protein